MKRNLRLALLAVVALTFIASTAHAFWFSQDVRWLRQRSYNVGVTQDSLWTTAAASKVDTSAGFTIDDAESPSLFQRGSSASDTLSRANLVIYSDSTVASAVNFKGSTFKLQANFGTNAVNWQDVITYSPTYTDGQKATVLPLWDELGLLTDFGKDLTQNDALHGASLRIIATWGASVAVPAARLRVVKYYSRTKN